MKDNIEKILSETFKNPDVMSYIVQQVKEQLEKEQKDETAKQEKLINKTKFDAIFEEHEKKMANLLKNTKLNKNVGPIVHDMDKKVKSYLNNNDFLKDYINNRDQFMSIFDQAVKKEPCEKCNYHCDEDCDYDSSTDSCSCCECKDDCERDSITKSYTSYTTGISQSVDEKGNPVGYIYFNLDSNTNIDIEKQLVDYYTLIKLHADEWTNWEQYHDDYEHDYFEEYDCLHSYIDEYSCVFDEERDYDEIPEKDMATSFIYTKLDDAVKSLTIYMLNFSRGTNILYDFKREIITIPEDATKKIIDEFYFNLSKYISNSDYLVTIPDFTGGKNNQCYDYINQYKINNHPITDDEGLAHDYLKNDISDTIKKFDNKAYFSAKKIVDDEKTQRNMQYDCIDFFRNAINDGLIKVEVFSPEHIHLNINGTKVFFNNPYACNPRKDILGND